MDENTLSIEYDEGTIPSSGSIDISSETGITLETKDKVMKTDLVIKANGGGGDAVKYTLQTGKSEAEKQTARSNIGAADQIVVEPLINQWDEEWILGSWSGDTGEYVPGTDTICSKNYIPVKSGAQYYVHTNETVNCRFYDSDLRFLTATAVPNDQKYTFTVPTSCVYLTFTMSTNYGITYNNDISINYPASYTGYYPTKHTKIRDSLGELSDAIIRGGWNQLIYNGNFVNLAGWHTSNGSFSVAGNAAQTSFQTDEISDVFIEFHSTEDFSNQKYVIGHKYLLTAIVRPTQSGKIYFSLNSNHLEAGTADRIEYSLTANRWRKVTGIVEKTSVDAADNPSGVRLGMIKDELTGTVAIQFKDIMVFDLTEIFGAGKEPTIDRFRQLFPNEYYPYGHAVTYGLGNVIVNGGWNQIANVSQVSGTVRGITWSNNPATGTVTATGTSESNDRIVICTFRTGHKYALTGFDGTIIAWTDKPTSTLMPTDRIYTATQVGSFYVRVNTGVTVNNYSITPQIFDLTEIFGAGNEPPTIERFKQLFPDNYYPYAMPGFGNLLWENASPSSQFAAQTINLNLSSYSKVFIEFIGAQVNSVMCPVGEASKTVFIDDNKLTSRTFDVFNDRIQFSNGSVYSTYGSAPTTNNTYCRPLRIYGIR